MGCKGYLFTWGNGRWGPGFVKERLDRVLCSKNWREIYDDCAAINLETWTSDHCPVLMEVNERGSTLNYTKRSTLRVHSEDMWSSYEGCKDII